MRCATGAASMSDEGWTNMTRNVQFDFSFESDLDDFDPLQDSAEDAREDADEVFGEAIPTVANATASPNDGQAPLAPSAPEEKPAEERTADLIKSMGSQRKTLLGILSFCAEAQPVSEVNALVEKLKEHNYSVYSAADLCTLLETAGALERVTADGADAESAETEPRVVVVDGVEYLEAACAPQTFWLTTDAGKAAVEADKPLDRLHDLLESDGAYRVIYQRILNLCSAEGGVTTKEINAAVDDDPLVQKPRYYAPRFVDKLEKCDALVWEGTWKITEVGKRALEILADVEDSAEKEA